MKKIIKNLRKKLDLNNSKRYVNGYYQLSRNQQFVWVFGLFALAFIFSCKVWLDTRDISDCPLDVMFAALVTMAVFLMLLSVIPVLLPFAIMFFLKKGSLIAFYQTWTVFALALIAAYILKFDASSFFPVLKFPILN